MSSGFKSTEHQCFGLSSKIGAAALRFESPPGHTTLNVTQAADRTTETHDIAPLLRFNNLTLSEELDKRTKETERLQEEVENATKEALERFGCIHGISSSPEQSCSNHRFNVDDPPGNFTSFSSKQPTSTQPQVHYLDSLNQGMVHKVISSPENETNDKVEHGTFSFDNAMANLQTKLHKVQMEKDILSDLRLKDSRKHVDQMEKMLCMLEELQNIKRAADEKLQETEDEALALNRKVEALEQIVKEMYSSLLSHETQCGNKPVTIPTGETGSIQLSSADKLTKDYTEDRDKLQGRLFLSVESRERGQGSGINNEKERMEDLIASLGQEMAVVTEKLSSSKNNSISISVKLEQLKELGEKQTSLHQCQVSELESTLSRHKDKICCLEQQLIQAQSQLMDAQSERERYIQQTEELQSQLSQMKRCGEQQCELEVQVKALRGQLEVAREQLHRAGEEKMCIHALLEQVAQEGRKSQELLREKDKDLQLRQQEYQQHLSRLEEAQRQCQTLDAEGEALRLKLEDSEKMINILRLQLESSIQTTVQHSRTMDNLHHESSLLSNQLNQHKLEIQQLRAELERHKFNLAAAEHERRQLQALVAEQSQRVQEETLEKQQLTTQLEVQRLQLLSLTKEYNELQQLHSCKNEEQEGVVLKLQNQLRIAHDELDQVRSTLRALEGADGYGLQAAMNLQQKITARREQVDSLQSKIQHLEEAMEKLYKEKRYQKMENQQRVQELTFIRAEKRQLADELEALCSKDRQLRDRIGELEAMLHKMSASFADCQDFIQLQEQEFFHLKLQHALDLKELESQNLHTALNVSPPVLDMVNPFAPTAPPSSQHASSTQIKSTGQQESRARELRSLVGELRAVISENHRPHTDNSTTNSSFHRRRSAPDRTHKAEEVKRISRLRRKTCSSEQHFLKTAELNGKAINKSYSESCVISSPVTAVRYTSSAQLLSLDRRSPVYCLLTSDPNS